MPSYSVSRYARKYGIPLKLANALIGQESGGRTDAVSPAGATGLTQVMPSTAAGMYGISEAEAARRLRNPQFALDAGFRYLAAQKKAFGSWRLALAAYNAGPNAVKEYGGVPPYQETQGYVRNILSKAKGFNQTVDAAGENSVATGQGVASSGPDPTGLALQNLSQIASGQYDPVSALSDLASQTAVEAPVSPPTALEAPTGTSVPPGQGFTYRGEKLTHDTDGLAGYPAIDLFKPPGTPFLAPENGKVVRLSGRGGTSGNVYGYSVYFQGDSGRKYYITHLNKRRARGRVKAGQPLGTVSPWKSGDPHAHVGVQGGGG